METDARVVGCSWCHELVAVRQQPQACPRCGHDADRARADCTCPKCWNPDDALADLVESALRHGDRGDDVDALVDALIESRR